MTTQLPFTMSKHALERALEMNVDGAEIRACFDQPEDVLWSRKYSCWWFVGGDLTGRERRSRTDMAYLPRRRT